MVVESVASCKCKCLTKATVEELKLFSTAAEDPCGSVTVRMAAFHALQLPLVWACSENPPAAASCPTPPLAALARLPVATAVYVVESMPLAITRSDNPTTHQHQFPTNNASTSVSYQQYISIGFIPNRHQQRFHTNNTSTLVS